MCFFDPRLTVNDSYIIPSCVVVFLDYVSIIDSGVV